MGKPRIREGDVILGGTFIGWGCDGNTALILMPNEEIEHIGHADWWRIEEAIRDMKAE